MCNATVIRNTDHGTELVTMRWGMPPPPYPRPPVTKHSQQRHRIGLRPVDPATPTVSKSSHGNRKYRGSPLGRTDCSEAPIGRYLRR